MSGLHAFEAAARHLSFTRAAAELCVTQSAISRLVKMLEEELGTLLFVRDNKRLRLTSAGDSYFHKIQPCLAKLESATVELKTSGGSGQLNLSVLPSFSAKWLMARFPGFSGRHPDILVNVSTRIGPANFHTEAIDAAIYFGEPNWPASVAADFLMKDALIPVCSPSLLPAATATGNPAGLTDFTLLHLTSRPQSWGNWFANVGLVPGGTIIGPSFEHYLMIIQAAAAGLGIGLVPKFLVSEELANGTLVSPYPTVMSEPAGYYLLYPKQKEAYAPLKLFRNWLLEEVAKVVL